jgi:hypothetical protein
VRAYFLSAIFISNRIRFGPGKKTAFWEAVFFAKGLKGFFDPEKRRIKKT